MEIIEVDEDLDITSSPEKGYSRTPLSFNEILEAVQDNDFIIAFKNERMLRYRIIKSPTKELDEISPHGAIELFLNMITAKSGVEFFDHAFRKDLFDLLERHGVIICHTE